jgi:hypothetical protein
MWHNMSRSKSFWFYYTELTLPAMAPEKVLVEFPLYVPTIFKAKQNELDSD